MLSRKESEDLLIILKKRFEKNMFRHGGIEWHEVEKRLMSQPPKLLSLQAMEKSGGEPDIVAIKESKYLFFDCSPESPAGRRSICYDRKAREKRKEHSPAHSALELTGEWGIELLDEAQYGFLQSLGPFDQKTSSWIKTPSEVRELGGAIFADYRFGRVFVYHNGAESYYSSRGFRALLRV